MARWLFDGDIQFLGRIDDQVKVRGFRIEPGEIENRLTAYPEVEQAVVIVSDSQLAAYMVMEKDEAPDIGELREFLRRELPDYMIPAYFMMLESFPLTGSGKVDKKALPDPRHGVTVSAVDPGEAPGSELEKDLMGIWRGLLGNPAIGIHENFFEVGGNSLLLIQMQMEIDKKYPGQVAVTDLFNYATISGIARFMMRDQSEPGLPVHHLSLSGEYLLAV
ncbi:MAG: non-ribosomal peptide synthetase, partial [bacterium]|nr:non-ribosomal peptide synthetase [bacterium]